MVLLKDEATNFNPDIANKNVTPFEYKAKLYGNKVVQPAPDQANGILKNAIIAVPLKYLNSFWRSLEMSLIIAKLS